MANKVCDNACLRALLPMETWKKGLTTINETLRNENRLSIGAYGRIVAGLGELDSKCIVDYRHKPVFACVALVQRFQS